MRDEILTHTLCAFCAGAHDPTPTLCHCPAAWPWQGKENGLEEHFASLPPSMTGAGPLPDMGLSCPAPLPDPTRGLSRRRRPQALGGVKEATAPTSHTWSQPRHALTQPCAPPSRLPHPLPTPRLLPHISTSQTRHQRPRCCSQPLGWLCEPRCMHYRILGSRLLCVRTSC